MSNDSITRKLTTILYTDVVAYSRLTGDDELGTHRAVMEVLDYTNAAIVAKGGTVLRYAGDAILAEFSSVVSCVDAAVAVQSELANRNRDVPDATKVQLRIGINLGEVISDRGEIFGNGVNVAARLESIAVPGGVCISQKVGAEVEGKLDVSFSDGGKHELKNIAEPLRVLHWHPDAGRKLPTASSAPGDSTDGGGRSGEKPSLMLMPFEPLTDDDQTKSLAASVNQEAASAVTKLTGILVVTASDGADYVAKGSVRAAGNRFRTTVQLLDRSNDNAFWSERFDGELQDMFEALDNLAARISTALRYQIHQREMDKAKSIPIEKQSSQELMGQAGHILFQSRRADYERSRALMAVVREREPDNPMALAISAWGLAMLEVICGYGEIAQSDGEAGLAFVRHSIELKEQSDFAHMVYGRLLLHWEQDVPGAIVEAERSLELNPGYVLGKGLLGAAKTLSGDPEAGIRHCTEAAQADPRFPANHWFMEDAALGSFVLEDYDAAVSWTRRADQKQRDVPRILIMLTAASWRAGQQDSAHDAAARLMESSPAFQVGKLKCWAFQHPPHLGRLRDALLESGLPA